MTHFHQYWTPTTIRGAVTLLAATAILVVLLGASPLLSIAALSTLAAGCIATYSLFDGGALVLLAKLMPTRAASGKALYAHAIMAMATGTVLFLLGTGGLGLRWILWIVAGRAAFAAFTEAAVERDTYDVRRGFFRYAMAVILGVMAVGLPFAGGLSAIDVSLVLGLYVGIYGTCQLTAGARMLFLDYRGEHPALHRSEAWRLEFSPLIASLRSVKAGDCAAALHCDACPATLLCHDNSLSGQLAAVLVGQVPAIVRSARIETTLTTAALHAVTA